VAQSVKPADVGVSVGQVLLGKYRVDSILGHGGMGVVAECMHLGLNERRAIKMLRQDVLTDGDAVERFTREARAAAKLRSEYVAKVEDVGVFDNGTPYMVMEYLDGQDLGVLLKERGVLPVPWAVELILQTAEALAEAHSLGIVHRDVKPTNLFVTWRPDGTSLVKVLDFGISKSAQGTDMHLTQTQSLLGTPAYMSPEQMRSARLVDSRTDIWSLGTVFYEALEGRKPFEAESFSEMCVKVAVDPPSPMVNTPPALQQVIMRCLAKSPEQRYSSMAELGRDLVPFSNDPHQAGLLVERMTRMLRRSGAGDFSGDTGTNVPRLVRDVGSAPVKAQRPSQWSVGSDPVGVPWHANSDPAMAQLKTPFPGTRVRGDGSQPFVRQQADSGSGPVAAGMTLRDPRRRRWPFVLVGFLLAAGIGGAIAFTQTQDDDQTVTAPTTPQPAQAATPPAPPAPAVDTKAAATPPTPVEATPPPAPPVEPKPTVKEAPKEPHHPTVKAGTGAKTGGGTKPKLAPQEGAAEPEKTVKETKPEVKGPPPGVDCDPTHYSSLRNYPAACQH
jgi:serine/threonine-protein kinase